MKNKYRQKTGRFLLLHPFYTIAAKSSAHTAMRPAGFLAGSLLPLFADRDNNTIRKLWLDRAHLNKIIKRRQVRSSGLSSFLVLDQIFYRNFSSSEYPTYERNEAPASLKL